MNSGNTDCNPVMGRPDCVPDLWMKHTGNKKKMTNIISIAMFAWHCTDMSTDCCSSSSVDTHSDRQANRLRSTPAKAHQQIYLTFPVQNTTTACPFGRDWGGSSYITWLCRTQTKPFLQHLHQVYGLSQWYALPDLSRRSGDTAA